jgi:AcrR family transcriptional regulator
MAGTRRKKTRTQPSLTSARVRDEALKLIEADGLEEFSTRKLGRALGVEAMAIYWYYPSKDALLDAVVETMVAQLDAPDPETLREASSKKDEPIDFIDALRRLAHGYRALAHAYPEAFQLLATRRFATEGTYKFLDNLFALAEQYGLDARTTARFYRLVASFCNGIALDELAGIRELEMRPDTTEARARVPRLAKVFGWLSPDHYEDVFSFGLELLLASLRAQAEAPAAKTPTKKKTASKKPR